MKEYTLYKDSGEIVTSGTCQDCDFYLQQREGLILLEGLGNIKTQYIKNNKITNLPDKPEGDYKFNYTTEKWEFDAVLADKNAKQKRDILLAEGPDRISPMWWASMTEQEQQAWTQYRQDLLDITEQADYPEFIVWPIKP